MDMLNKILNSIDKSPTQFQVVENIEKELIRNGFIKLQENSNFKLSFGEKYYVKRNDSSIISFKIPAKPRYFSFLIAASHTDSPSFKIKPNPIINSLNLSSLDIEPYGGSIYSSWLDRPLSIAGRLLLKDNNKLITRLVNIDKDLLVIPNLCIHMNRDINNGHIYNASKDMIPVLTSTQINDFKVFLKNELNIKEDIISYDLFLYQREKAKVLGLNEEFIISPKLDNLVSVYTSLYAFIESNNDCNINVFVAFDNEEVGSLTRQGANSTFLKDILSRIINSLSNNNEEYYKAIASSFMLSIDNAHANHPNFKEMSDQNTHVYLNNGVAVKYNANQSYTSDALSSSLIKEIANRSKLHVQEYTNRSDLRGGSTLGNISNSEVSLLSCDIGIPQLAMHSANEVCGKNDIIDLYHLTKSYYSSKINILGDKITIE